MPEKLKLYRPSNGTEGDYFMAEFCENCYHDGIDKDSPEGSCPILFASFAYGIEDDKYPHQWRYVNGEPVCVSFYCRAGETK
jgi:hypothetical protein